MCIRDRSWLIHLPVFVEEFIRDSITFCTYKSPAGAAERASRERLGFSLAISLKFLQVCNFVLTYRPSWLISQLVLQYTSSFVSQKRQEKHSGCFLRMRSSLPGSLWRHQEVPHKASNLSGPLHQGSHSCFMRKLWTILLVPSSLKRTTMVTSKPFIIWAGLS